MLPWHHKSLNPQLSIAGITSLKLDAVCSWDKGLQSLICYYDAFMFKASSIYYLPIHLATLDVGVALRALIEAVLNQTL